MQYLLVTHTFLLFTAGSNELSANAKNLIISELNVKIISIASFWEIAIKLKNKKLELDISFVELKKNAINNGFKIIPVKFNDTLLLTDMELFHRDPFDRLLIAQAINNNFTIITRDNEFLQYPVNTIW